MFGQNNNNNSSQPVSTQPVNPGLLGIDDENDAGLEPVTPPFPEVTSFSPTDPPAIQSSTDDNSSSNDNTGQSQTSNIQSNDPAGPPPVAATSSDDSGISSSTATNDQTDDSTANPSSTQTSANDVFAPSTPSGLPSNEPSTTSASTDELVNIKKLALTELSPLINHLDQNAEERFKTTMMMIQASDDKNLIPDAFTAAKAITDEKQRAQALLDIVNEINYFTHKSED